MMVKTGGGGGGANGFYRAITIDHTKVGSSDSSNFPVAFFGTYSWLKTVANGGKVDNSAGINNIRVYSSSGLSTLRDFELVSWDGTTGKIELHYREPTLSHTVDPVFYIKYGASADTSDVSNKTGVWDSNFLLVQHFGDGTTLSLADSTSNAFTGSGSNTPLAGTGIIGGAMKSNNTFGSSLETVTTGDPATGPQNNVTASIWVNASSNTGQLGLYSWAGAVSSGTPFILIQNNGGTLQYYVDGNYRDTSSTVTTGVWTRYVVTLASATTWKFYKNNTLLSTYTGGVANRSGATKQFAPNGFQNTSLSDVDEMRISYTTRGPDWLTAEYNNITDGAFYSVGAEVPL